jgi:hypothetical protein
VELGMQQDQQWAAGPWRAGAGQLHVVRRRGLAWAHSPLAPGHGMVPQPAALPCRLVKLRNKQCKLILEISSEQGCCTLVQSAALSHLSMLPSAALRGCTRCRAWRRSC